MMTPKQTALFQVFKLFGGGALTGALIVMTVNLFTLQEIIIGVIVFLCLLLAKFVYDIELEKALQEPNKGNEK